VKPFDQAPFNSAPVRPAQGKQDKQDKRFAAIDGLRGLAILSITVLHLWSLAGCPQVHLAGFNLAPFLAAGSLGPSVFFAISGFVLYASLSAGTGSCPPDPQQSLAGTGSCRPDLRQSRRVSSRCLSPLPPSQPNRCLFTLPAPLALSLSNGNGVEGSSAEGSPFPLRRFYARRLTRIVPAYYVAVLAWWAVSTDHSPFQLVTHLTFTHGFFEKTLMGLSAPLWFIAPLVHFYLIFPLVAVAMRRWPVATVGVAFAVSIAAQVLGGALPALSLSNGWQRSLPGHIAECAFGMYGAHLMRQSRPEQWLRKPQAIIVLTAAAAPVVMHLVHPATQPPFWNWAGVRANSTG